MPPSMDGKLWYLYLDIVIPDLHGGRRKGFVSTYWCLMLKHHWELGTLGKSCTTTFGMMRSRLTVR